MQSIVINPMQDGLAAAKMIRNVLDVCRPENAGGKVEASNLDADAMAATKQIGGRKNLDVVFGDFSRGHRFLRFPRQWMPRLPGLRSLGIEGAVRRL